MGKNNSRIIIAIVIFGVLALGMTAMLLMGHAGAPAAKTVAAAPTPKPPVKQFVANQDISPRTSLTPDMFHTADIPADEAKPGALTRLDQVQGKMAGAPIARGQIVTASMITDPVQRAVPANIPVPMGLRAVAVYIDPNQTVGGLVDVGDRVDVLVTHKLSYDKVPNEYIIGTNAFTSARTIAQDVLVLAVDKSIAAAAIPTPVPGSTPNPAATPAPAAPATGKIRVVVAASPDQVQHIAAAIESGTMYMSIRNPASSEQVSLRESHEYPSRAVIVKPAPVGASEEDHKADLGLKVIQALTGRGQQNEGVTPMIPSPSTGVGSNDKEITVIRGTDKTRVIVPPG